MALRDFFKKKAEKSNKFKEMQENFQLQKMLEERQKTANERELERFYEEERQKEITQNLEEFRKHRQKESMKTTVLGGKYLFNGKGNIMTSGSEVLNNNHKLFSMKPKSGGKSIYMK